MTIEMKITEAMTGVFIKEETSHLEKSLSKTELIDWMCETYSVAPTVVINNGSTFTLISIERGMRFVAVAKV